MPDIETNWSAEQVRFSEDARRAARGALYYSRQLEPGHEKDWGPFLLTEVAAQLAAVSLPRRRECCGVEGGLAGDPCKFIGVQEPFLNLLARWHRLCRLANANTDDWAI